jgi:hypothetical protein
LANVLVGYEPILRPAFVVLEYQDPDISALLIHSIDMDGESVRLRRRRRRWCGMRAEFLCNGEDGGNENKN